jgi:hypothetical protein
MKHHFFSHKSSTWFEENRKFGRTKIRKTLLRDIEINWGLLVIKEKKKKGELRDLLG